MKHFKKAFIALFVLLFTPTLLLASTPRNEVYLGYGYPKSLSTICIGGFTEIFTTIFSAGQATQETKGPGITQVGYNRFLTDNIAVGGTFTFEPFKVINTSGGVSTTTDYANIGIMGSFKYQYGWEYVKLYHGVRAGLSLQTTIGDGSTNPLFAFDLIPIGIKIGPMDGFNFYADVGLWTTAFINAGATFNF